MNKHLGSKFDDFLKEEGILDEIKANLPPKMVDPKLEVAIVKFMYEVNHEVNRACTKFPDPWGLSTALTEEVGELAKALMDEPSKNVYTEAVQVAAMACRIAIQGDPSLDRIREARGQDGHPNQESNHGY